MFFSTIPLPCLDLPYHLPFPLPQGRALIFQGGPPPAVLLDDTGGSVRDLVDSDDCLEEGSQRIRIWCIGHPMTAFANG